MFSSVSIVLLSMQMDSFSGRKGYDGLPDHTHRSALVESVILASVGVGTVQTSPGRSASVPGGLVGQEGGVLL